MLYDVLPHVGHRQQPLVGSVDAAEFASGKTLIKL